MKALVLGALIIALICNNEVLSLIFLLCAGIWGVFKLFSEMDRGGYK